MRLSRFDHLAFALLILAAIPLSVRGWLAAHPQHDPWAPLDLNDPPGWATGRKLAALRDDPEGCRAVLARSGVAFTALDPAGEGACARRDRVVLPTLPLSPANPPTTCALGAGLALWLREGVQPAARELVGSRVTGIEHFGTFSCRRLYGRGDGRWSEHASGNAIDVAAFVLADGRRIRVADGWSGKDAAGAFLHRARNKACEVFGTVLSPDYNAAHRDHFHLDQQARSWGSVCR
jgi:hypothetical protein